MDSRPPKWQQIITKELIEKIHKSSELKSILDKAQKNYAYWDKFKYYSFPKGFKPEEAWSYLKISSRISGVKTPIKTISGDHFTYNLPSVLYQKLNFIDIHGSGLVKSLSEKPFGSQMSKYIISNLTEEAIASSQIEGANTTHKIAKEMILSKRKPRNKSEQMIVNNYLAMQKMEEWKDLDLTEEMLLDLQVGLTKKTLDESSVGRFRNDQDEIVIHDPITGDIVHTPPAEKEMRSELKRLVEYANKKDNEEDDFTHPVIKATILHFWLAYLHPFVDGNGRSSRAIFYWYLQKNNYWLIEYVSVSRAIKQSRKAYDNAFLYSERDDNDLSYFLLYITETFKKSIIQFLEHFEEKTKQEQAIRRVASVLIKFNDRQVAVLSHFSEHSSDYTDVIRHQNKHGVSRPTAYNDLSSLVADGYLTATKKGKRLIFMPNISKIKKIIK